MVSNIGRVRGPMALPLSPTRPGGNGTYYRSEIATRRKRQRRRDNQGRVHGQITAKYSMPTNVKEINPCAPNSWRKEFETTAAYQQAITLYNHVISSYREMSLLKAAWHHTVYELPRVFCEQYKILDCVPFYYIEKVMQSNPATVVDLGCGLNVFKKIYPNIVGVDSDPNSKFDVFDFFDADFAQGHTHYYNGLISINTIHFSPIDTITQRLLMVKDLVKPGGRAFVSFNLETWLMHTDKTVIDTLFGPVPQFDDIVKYVDQQIIATDFDFEVIDWPVLRTTSESSIRDDYNGNIRLVFNCD